MVHTDQSFSSAKDDGPRYRLFPDSDIAKSYRMSDSNV